MTRMVTITDTLTDQAATVEANDIAATITDWYPEPTDEMVDAIEQLQTGVCRDLPIHHLEAYLALRVERV